MIPVHCSLGIITASCERILNLCSMACLHFLLLVYRVIFALRNFVISQNGSKFENVHYGGKAKEEASAAARSAHGTHTDFLKDFLRLHLTEIGCQTVFFKRLHL